MQIKKGLRNFYTFVLLGMVFLPRILRADDFPIREDDPPPPRSPSDNSEGLQNPIQFNSISEFLEAFLEVVIQVGAPLVVLAIIYSGFLFVRAQGKPEDLQKAKGAFFWTIIGALLILGASVILALLKGTTEGLLS